MIIKISINFKKIKRAVLFGAACFGVYKTCFFKIPSKKSKELYDVTIAHRGFHMLYPENTIEAYEAAVNANMGVELDIRRLKDGNIVCFHDRYTYRLLGVPGKTSSFSLQKIKKLFVNKSKSKVPTFEEALKKIDGRVPVLVEVKGTITSLYLSKILEILGRYEKGMKGSAGVYFHTKNIKTYFKLKDVFGDKVFFVLNPLRKRMKFVKGSDYKKELMKYNELRTSLDIQLPTPDDLAEIITSEIQELEDKNSILAGIGKVLNNYETRVDKNHWINNSLWLHRGIISKDYLEHSRESFIACREYAVKNKIRITVEFDLMLYKGEVRCYHKDKIPSLLGQEKSCAEKLKLENSLSLSEILSIFAGYEDYVNLALDIKDYRIKNRELEYCIISDIESSKYEGNFICMSYNPLVLNFFKEVRPEYLRAQIGHSLKGLRKVPFFRFPWLLNGILGVLFDIGSADCCLFDNSNWIFWMIAYHANIKGKPVLIYPPQNYMEIESFIGKESISNFIVENAADKTAWPEEYLEKFRL